MTIPSCIQKFCDYMYKHYSKDGGQLLVHMGAAGWVFGSAAQLTMLAADKKIDKNQKKFLLPQEAADAAVNVIMYYSICDVIKKGADHIVEKGKFITDKVADSILSLKPDSMKNLQTAEWKNLFTKEELKSSISNLLKNPENLDIVKNVSDAEKTKIIEAAKKALSTFENHKNNVGTVAAIAASVIACNIVTPYARNKVAAKVQKSLQKEENLEIRKRQISENITTKNPLPPSFKAFNNYNSLSGLKI